MQMPRFEVPEALVMEILSKLPVKSLTRFNCVCKYWCSFFRTPHFISKHYHNNVKNNNLNLVLQRHDHGTANMPYFSQSHTYACVYFNHGAFVFDSKADDYKFLRFVTLSFVNTEYETEFAENMKFHLLIIPHVFSVSPIPKFFESYREHYIQVLVFNLINRLEYGINNSALNLFPCFQHIGFKVVGIKTYMEHHQHYISVFAFVENRVPINGIQEHKDHIICQLVGDAPNKY
ncbi:hypothetical protein ERO13_D10G238332v2 [Gossypium hirsutum]|uniref:F-box domain-containing protein n=1 Tax=Gossypium barbadense TaxID=3634 RepID=A0A5J5Q0G6_GOSBA|nr:hypothetical protein ES319_D10G275900v1 [Gossypium barbadense]KAG4127839.1 hypothetical protein ERO13_D10G238332v2 [Gossypium hirsutum]